jgi:hypothetical protein
MGRWSRRVRCGPNHACQMCGSAHIHMHAKKKSARASKSARTKRHTKQMKTAARDVQLSSGRMQQAASSRDKLKALTIPYEQLLCMSSQSRAYKPGSWTARSAAPTGAYRRRSGTCMHEKDHETLWRRGTCILRSTYQ